MSPSELLTGNFERQPLSLYSEQSYLDYAMYVILDRALPFIGDGLKPVQRRIIYAMSELGLNAGKRYKKSARTVGDVIGKYHPHGDSAVYEAMVIMSQDFATRYPLIDGQGNWGSADDPKSFAAMRYTEARLTDYTALLLEELGQGTVAWIDNFDDTLKEPAVLPAQVPHILLGGISGIAVGMATDIPPHNLGEVIAACIHLLDQPRATEEELLDFIRGPDFPTGANIHCSRDELLKIYQSGRGLIKTTARWNQEDGKIVISGLPWQTSGAQVMEQIAAQIEEKKLPMIADLRDESDHEHPTRIVIVPRSSRIDVQALMEHLLATTNLSRNCKINMNMIGLDGRPRVHSLQQLCADWLTFRKEIVTRRLKQRLSVILRRLHLLEGLLIAFLNLDEVIAIIRESEHPKAVLIEKLELSAEQAEAILETKLRKLARLEEMRIREESDKLSAEAETINRILKSKARLKTLVKKELTAVARQHGDPRRSEITASSHFKSFSVAEILPADPITVILSKQGWIRAAKGLEIQTDRLSWRSGDQLLSTLQTHLDKKLAVLDSSGRAYTLDCHTLPSARGHGIPLAGRLNAPSGVHFTGLISPAEYHLLCSKGGFGFMVRLNDLLSNKRGGKLVMHLTEGDEPLKPAPWNDNQPRDALVAVCTSDRLLVFSAEEIPFRTSGKGVRLINLPEGDNSRVVGVVLLTEHDTLILHSAKGKRVFNLPELEYFKLRRNTRGRVVQRLSTIVEMEVVKKDHS